MQSQIDETINLCPLGQSQITHVQPQTINYTATGVRHVEAGANHAVYGNHNQLGDNNRDDIPRVTHAKVLQIFRQSSTLSNFATSLMIEYFTREELTREDTNVTGRRTKGMKEPINGLCLERMELIRQTVLGYAEGSCEDKMKVWIKATKAMSKKMSSMKEYSRLALRD